MSGGDGEHGAPDSWRMGGKAQQPASAGRSLLDLGDRDRLPWLESDDEDTGVDSGRVKVAVAAALLAMAGIVGGVWYVSHRHAADAPVADGSLIAPPPGPWREAPKDPGGKQFDGTGDTSYAVSQGQNRPAQLAADESDRQAGSHAAPLAAPAPAGHNAPAAHDAPAAQPPLPADSPPSGPAGGVVQLAAYTSHTQAEAGWNRLVTAHEILKGMNHRIVTARIELGTVYRLQIITGAGGGRDLCERLTADGITCQVKH